MNITEDIEKLTEPLLTEAGIELVQVQYKHEEMGWTLRFYLDKEDGFGLKDCQYWTNELSRILDENDLLTDQSYALEVSSPGLNRPLTKAKDFQRFMGMDVIIKLKEPTDQGQKNIRGKMTSCENNLLSVMDRTSGLLQFSLDTILSAKLDAPS